MTAFSPTVRFKTFTYTSSSLSSSSYLNGILFVLQNKIVLSFLELLLNVFLYGLTHISGTQNTQTYTHTFLFYYKN
jgi:hypothetical protein